MPVTLVQFSTYVISGLMAAFSGIAITMLTGSGNAEIGASMTLNSITAVVIGGTAMSGGIGGVAGPVMGAITLGIDSKYYLVCPCQHLVGDVCQGGNHCCSPGYTGHHQPVQEAGMKRFTISPPVAALLLAVILFILSGLLPNGYGSDLKIATSQALNILRLSVFLGVIAAGQTLVIISGFEGIDLSAGSVVTLTAILTYVIVSGANERVLPALLVSLAVGAFIGFLNGVGITFLKISPFVMTLGMSGVVTGAILVINHGNVSGKVAPIMTRLIARPISPSFPIPTALVIWLIFGILMWLLLERTTFGKNLFAIGVNRVTAKLSGVNVTGMNLATYALAGALAGFGGFLVVGNTGVVFIALGQPFLFPSIAAVAVGGTLLSGGKGSYWGTMAGAIVLDPAHQPADHHANARFGPPHGAGRNPAAADLHLRPSTGFTTIEPETPLIHILRRHS